MDPSDYKRCQRCGEIKYLADFWSYSAPPNEHHLCSDCFYRSPTKDGKARKRRQKSPQQMPLL